MSSTQPAILSHLDRAAISRAVPFAIDQYVTVTSPTGHSIGNVKLGLPLDIAWQMSSPGFAIASVEVTMNVHTALLPDIGPNVTS
jgi:hypothetical protein